MREIKCLENLEDDIETVKVWLKKQHHLPQNIDDQFIKRFILCSDGSLEKTKNLIDLNYTLRNQAPDIFDNRDPKSIEVQNIFDLIDFCPLPKLTDKKYKVFIYRVTDSDPDKFQYSDALKAFFMVADIRMYTDFENSEGEIPIFDMAGTTLRHLTKVTIPLMKKYMVYTQEAHPVRLRQIHVLNTAPFLDKCLALVKPFLKSEVAKLLNFHQPNSTTLFEHIPRELLPEDYGGTLGVSMNQIKKEWRQKVEDNRRFYLDESRWKVDELNRPRENKNNQNFFGMQGSFKTLTID